MAGLLRVVPVVRGVGFDFVATHGLHYAKIDGTDFTEADIIQLVTAWETEALPKLRALMHQALDVVGLDVKAAPNFERVHYVSYQAGAQRGTAPGNALPTFVAGCLSLRTRQPGRSGRGRIYLPPSGEDFSINQPQAEYINALNAYGQAIKDNMETYGYSLMVYSRKNGVAYLVTSYSAVPYWASQVRRKVRL